MDHEKRIIHVRGLDLLDGTPVLDVKPYVPYADAFPDASAGWLDDLKDMKGPDRKQNPPTPKHQDKANAARLSPVPLLSAA